MKKSTHFRLLLFVTLLLAAIFSTGVLTLAQKDDKGRKASERRKNRTTSVSKTQENNLEEGRAQVKGERGSTVRSAVVNFAAIARKEAQGSARPHKPKDADGPEPDYDNLPIPAGAIISGKDSAVASGSNSSRDGEQGGPLAASPAPLSSFSALPDGLNSIPPDTHGAVGPNHLMVTLNTQIRIQDRNGATLSTVTLDSFWSSLGNPDTFDPKLLYDPFAGRWIFTVCANSDSANAAILIGASQTSDPTGNWNLYTIDADPANQLWADYPSIGFNKDWIVVHVNLFPISSATPRTKVFAISKASVYAGGATASFTGFDRAIDNSFNQTMVPAVTYDNAQATMYLVSRWSSSAGSLRIFTLSGPVGGETLTPTNFFPSSPTPWSAGTNGAGDFGQQAGSNQKVSNGDTRLQQVIFRNGSLWAVHHIFLPAGEVPTRTAVQWWQIDPATGAVLQRATIDDPSGTTSYAYPSIAVNKFNDVLVGYSRYSATQFVSGNYSFRAGTDPLNSLREDTVLKAGEGPYYKTFGSSRNRWGDYSSSCVDPLNDIDMWTIQEYTAATPAGCVSNCGRWGTWWGRITADGTPPGAAPAPTPVPVPAAVPANNNFANAQAISGCSGSITGSNLSATKEAGEPNYEFGAPSGKTVWYNWQAPITGTVSFDTRGNSFDTILAAYAGNSVNALGTALAANDDAAEDLSSSISFSVTAGTTYRIVVDGWGTTQSNVASGYFALSWNISGCTGAQASTFQFSSANYSALEGSHYALITVFRSGNTSGAATVDFSTADSNATQRTDYATAVGTLSFASGQTSKTFAIVITDDAYVEANETITLTLSNPTGGAGLGGISTSSIALVENDAAAPTANPIDEARFFVRQNYADFLSRVPDQGGLDYWTGQITQCGSNVGCINFWRSAVSAAFFIELEFQSTGSFVYRTYQASYGVRPAYGQFTPDRARLVDTSNLEQNKQNFTLLFVQRPEFIARYPLTLDGPAFVDAVLLTVQQASQVNLTGQRNALIGVYNSAGGGNSGRAAVLRSVADNPTFTQAEYNKAFVLMQYFGFLKRDPDDGGYQFWLGVVNNSVPNDPRGYRSMVCAFITSPEYQQRFSSVVTRNDTVCAPQ
ncbi:MAG TPA: Calx-beta domain-containing protein [Pyrinomonadaceae bacterium]|jgi:hypothetical protein